MGLRGVCGQPSTLLLLGWTWLACLVASRSGLVQVVRTPSELHSALTKQDVPVVEIGADLDMLNSVWWSTD